MKTIERTLVSELLKRLRGPPQPLQIVLGPRQVGKTTALEHVLAHWEGPKHYASADLPAPPDAAWIQSQWQVARLLAGQQRQRTLLVLDEVQKVPRWSEVVKALYDEERRSKSLIRVVLLGSSSLHVERGAEESLAGRFELLFCPHWTWPECREAFGWSLDQWLFWGGYPGAAPLVRDQARWRRFISDSLIESVLSRDVLQLTPVLKPALLRQLFMLAMRAPGHVLSYNKMLGQLTDAGNTVTLAHYLNLLSSAFLVSGLNLWRGGVVRQRASSPKLIVWNNALITSLSGLSMVQARRQKELWGRLVENAVGAHLLNNGFATSTFYWQQSHAEVDFIIERGRQTLALEVKSGKKSESKGLATFRRRHPDVRTLVLGAGGVPLEQFFATDPQKWL
ncbi:MAG: ATP-binding protein [Myxococcota bacterium]